MTHPKHDDVVSVRLLFVALEKVRGRKEEDDRKQGEKERGRERGKKRCGNTSLKRLIGASAYIEKREEGGGENDEREIVGRFSSGRRASSTIPGIRGTGTRGQRDERDEGGHGESEGRVHMSQYSPFVIVSWALLLEKKPRVPR